MKLSTVLRAGLPALVLFAPAALGIDIREKRITCESDRNHLNPQWSIDRAPQCDTRGDRILYEVREVNSVGKQILRLYATTKVGKDTSPGCPVGFTDPVAISEERSDTSRAQWSPVSGDTIVAQKKVSGRWQIVKIVIGVGEQILTTERSHHVNPRWSQDGRFIVFEKKTAHEPIKLGIVCANGCAEFAVETPNDGADRQFPSFHWSTSGRPADGPYRIVYEVARGTASDIGTFEFSELAALRGSGAETLLTSDGEPDRFPQYVDDFFLWQRFDLAIARWQVVDRAASLATPIRILTADFESGDAEADHLFPRVALNNPQKVIYVKSLPPIGTGGQAIFRLLRPNTDEVARIVERRALDSDAGVPQWAPNGDNIVFQKRVDGRSQIFILDTVK